MWGLWTKTITVDKVTKVVTTADEVGIVQWIVKHPFRSYVRVGSFTFGVCFMANFVTTMFSRQNSSFAVANPGIFSTALLSKSFFHGVLWPAFYINAVVEPMDVFVLGGGVERVTKSCVSDLVDEIEKTDASALCNLDRQTNGSFSQLKEWSKKK